MKKNFNSRKESLKISENEQSNGDEQPSSPETNIRVQDFTKETEPRY